MEQAVEGIGMMAAIVAAVACLILALVNFTNERPVIGTLWLAGAPLAAYLAYAASILAMGLLMVVLIVYLATKIELH